MDYDPTRKSLYVPESGDPLPDFSAAWDIDQICAELSRLAYYHFELKDAPRLDAALQHAGFTAAEPFEGPARGAQAFGTTRPDGCRFVAFRGTEAGKLLDLVADARFKLVPFGAAARVHEGFLAAYTSLQAAIGKWLGAADGKRLVVTGHSLGAAMATLLAAERREAELVTFGSPRVGDPAFAAMFAKRMVRRYVDCTDGVTAVPPALIGYAHLSGEHYIDHSGQVHVDPPTAEELAEDRRAGRVIYASRYAWKVWRNVLVRELADHAPVNYVSAVTGKRTG
ncbi:MAG: triacylglycerol lipase [Sphingomonadales bacterium]|jgi:pimeloyl-ACP methyl ester carboxylesterase|nr:triacylglycerol lipase [Sphingomonadales bacterium]